MKKLSILLMILILGATVNCTGKKKKAFLMLPFMATLVGDSETGNSNTSGSASEQEASAPNEVTNSQNESFEVVANGSSGSTGTAIISPSDPNTSGSGDSGTSSNNTSGSGDSGTSSNNTSGSGDSGTTSNNTSGSGDSGTTSNNTSGSGDSGTTSNNTSGSGDSGTTSNNTSGSGGSGTTSNNTSGSDGSGTTSNNPPVLKPTVVVSVSTGDSQFLYENTLTVPVNMTVTDGNGNAIPGAVVIITDSTVSNPNGNTLFQQVTNGSGTTGGSITVNSTTEQVEVVVIVNGDYTNPIPIPIVVPVQTENGTENGVITSIDNVQIPVDNTNNQGNSSSGNNELAKDSDGDGVPDSIDAFPNDPTKASTIRYPAEGLYTIAFEDLFPVPGDADFNDYVVQFYNEEDLNSKGEVVEIRGKYQHVAKGAGYNHELRLRLPYGLKSESCKDDNNRGHGNDADGSDDDNPGNSTGINSNALNNRNSKDKESNCLTATSDLDISYESLITDNSGSDQKTGIVRFNPNSEQLFQGLLILGNSSKTIQGQNAKKDETYKPGHIASTKIVFNKPIAKQTLGPAPYDLFINVLSKKINNSYPSEAPSSSLGYFEIHLPGKYKTSSGKDVYLDNSGFPWAIVVPGLWAWPLEGSKYDIRKGNSPYPDFILWTNSKGKTNKNWYLNIDQSKAYNLPDHLSPLLAYLRGVDSINAGIILGILSVSFGFLLLRKNFIAT
ncbi:MAG: LruC domain-containing protein [Leptospiraceae bacterium]|nr:LruC domain-containing protein [Leptospiraceae bacterium]MCP5511205.1 LruC domain-containing protein [Leptospiraceae bacterium]